MSGYSANIKRIFFQSIGIAILFHILFLGLTTMRVSSKKIFLRPSIKFLGSFLTALDTQQGTAHPSLKAAKSMFQAPTRLPKTSGIVIETPNLPLSTLLPNTAKKTLPDARIVLNSEALKQEAKDRAEPFTHRPLKLPDYDHSRP